MGYQPIKQGKNSMGHGQKAEYTEELSAQSGDKRASAADIHYHPLPHPLTEGEVQKDPVWRMRFDVADERYSTAAQCCFGLDINGEVTLGRGNDSPALFDLNPYGASDLGVSRHHLMLRPTPNKLFAVELGSTNGTTLNGNPMGYSTPYSLMNGDVLMLGHLRLTAHIIDRPRSQTTWLARELSLADALSEIGQAITSQLELEEVFNQVTETARSLTSAGETGIWLIDEKSGELVLEAERGMADAQIRWMRIPIDADSPAGKVIQSGETLRVNRLPDEAQIKVKTNYLVEALLYVPIKLGGVTFGVVSAVHREPGKQFNERDERLLRAIAQFAAIAIQNARLYEVTDEALARRVTELSALNEVSRAVSASLDLERVYQVLVTQINKHWPVEAIRLYRLNAPQGQLELLFKSDNAPCNLFIPVSTGLLGRVSQTGVAMIANQPGVSLDVETAVSDYNGNSLHSIACVPLRVQEKIIGVLALLNKTDGKFSDEDLKRLMAFSHPLATAIENARLFAEAQRQKAAIETTAQMLRQPLIFLDENGQILISNQAAENLQENHTAQFLNAISQGVGRTQEIEIGGGFFLSTTEHVANVGTIVVMQDITYVKQLEKDRANFMHALSHDLKSPLASVMGWTYLIQKGVPPEAKEQQYAQKLMSAASSMLNMINQLLQSVEKLELHTMKRPCRFEEIVAEALNNLEGAALSKGLNLHYKQQGMPYPIIADALRLYHMVLNLVDNAIKYSPESSDIHINVNFSATGITIQVQDQGPGIPEKDTFRIFDKYYRGAQFHTAKPGVGLGLTLVKDIVEAHDGQIVVTPAPGQGSQFTVTLPASLRATSTTLEPNSTQSYATP